MLAIGILIVGIFARLIWHTPNFTPVMALALFGGMYLGKKKALLIPLALMVISDMVIGLHNLVLFTWGSVLLISALGLFIRSRKSLVKVVGSSMAAAVMFFIITNFGAWLVMYPKTMQGFINCYVLAVPFFRSTLFSTVVYTVALYGFYEAIAWRVKDTRLARVLS